MENRWKILERLPIYFCDSDFWINELLTVLWAFYVQNETQSYNLLNYFNNKNRLQLYMKWIKIKLIYLRYRNIINEFSHFASVSQIINLFKMYSTITAAGKTGTFLLPTTPAWIRQF